MSQLSSSPNPAPIAIHALAQQVAVGDVVFVRIPFKPFGEVAAATGTWRNHVGIVVAAGVEPLIAESRFPLSGTTTLSRFVRRSQGGRVAVARMMRALSPPQAHAVARATALRAGVFYDTGFDLHSRRQFCSRYIHEVLHEATGTRVGKVETFSQLLAQQPDVRIRFWQLWYLGRIPWSRETVTPASLLHSPELAVFYDGRAARALGRGGC